MAQGKRHDFEPRYQTMPMRLDAVLPGGVSFVADALEGLRLIDVGKHRI